MLDRMQSKTAADIVYNLVNLFLDNICLLSFVVFLLTSGVTRRLMEK